MGDVALLATDAASIRKWAFRQAVRIKGKGAPPLDLITLAIAIYAWAMQPGDNPDA